METQRMLKRKWDRYHKMTIPKSTSLPVLRLLPRDRPIFCCGGCYSSHSRCAPICLWCSWTSPETTSKFIEDSESMSRARTMSAPFLASTSLTLSPGLENAALACRPPKETGRLHDGLPAVTMQPLVNTKTQSNPQAVSLSKPHHLRLSSLPKRKGIYIDCFSPTISHGSPTSAPATMDPVGRVNRRTLSATSHMIVGVELFESTMELSGGEDGSQDYHETWGSQVHAGAAAPERMLRRKRAFDAGRPAFSRWPEIAPSEATLLGGSMDSTLNRVQQRSSLSSLKKKLSFIKPTTVDPVSPTPPLVRLGHPSRPYYSAIRKNIPAAISSPPSSFVPIPRANSPARSAYSHPPSLLCRTSSPSHSRHTQSRLSRLSLSLTRRISACDSERPMRVDVDVDDNDNAEGDNAIYDYCHQSYNHMSMPVSHARSGGYSLSGETELRMALGYEDYVFHETKKAGRVKRFGQGLKGLVLGKA